MSGDFFERMQHLIDSCGPGTLTATVTVDQVYAKYQELRDDLVLHGGGQHHYVRDALYGQLPDIKRAIAAKLITPDGSDVHSGVSDAAELMSRGVFERAPFEFGDLKASGHPTAADNGAVYYDRPPMVERLSEDDLRAKGDLRRLGFGNGGITGAAAGELGIA